MNNATEITADMNLGIQTPIEDTINENKKTMTSNQLIKYIRESIMDAMENQDVQSSEDVYTEEDWARDHTLKVKEGQLIAPEVYWQLLGDVPPMTNGLIFQPGEAYDYDPKNRCQLYMTFKKEGDDMYRYIGLRPAYNGNTQMYESKSDSMLRLKIHNILAEALQSGGIKVKTIKRDGKPVHVCTIDGVEKEMSDEEFAKKFMLSERSKSVAQQQFFGIVDAYKKGELKGDEVSKSVKDAANGMTMKQVKDFAKTKHKGLPDHVDENTLRNVIRETLSKTCANEQRNNRSFYDYAEEYRSKTGSKLPDEQLRQAAKKNDERFHERKKQDGKCKYVSQKELNESYAQDGNYTHFAVNKQTNKIVDGWDYTGYDPEELRQYKMDYFYDDLKANDLDPKQYTIITRVGCKKRGINPDDDTQWENQTETQTQLSETAYSSRGGMTDEHDIETFKNFVRRFPTIDIMYTALNLGDNKIKNALMLYKDLLMKVSNAVSVEAGNNAFHWFYNMYNFLARGDMKSAEISYQQSYQPIIDTFEQNGQWEFRDNTSLNESQLNQYLDNMLMEMAGSSVNENWKGAAVGAAMGLSSLIGGGMNAQAQNTNQTGQQTQIERSVSKSDMQNVYDLIDQYYQQGGKASKLNKMLQDPKYIELRRTIADNAIHDEDDILIQIGSEVDPEDVMVINNEIRNGGGVNDFVLVNAGSSEKLLVVIHKALLDRLVSQYMTKQGQTN